MKVKIAVFWLRDEFTGEHVPIEVISGWDEGDERLAEWARVFSHVPAAGGVTRTLATGPAEWAKMAKAGAALAQ